MKNKIYSLITASLVFIVSCEKDPEVVYETITVTETETVTVTVPATTPTTPTVTIPETQTVGSDSGIYYINEDTTWTNDRIWIMDGKIVVQDQITLTIQPGTIIKSTSLTGVDSTALIVAKGGKIRAIGTADSPIIFTDIEDQLDYTHNGVSPNRVATDTGKWGGIILLGKATVGEDGGEDDIEGIASGYPWTKYGGTNDADDSGVMSYVSIRHNGIAISEGNEIQGLTMGGVGSATTISNIEVVGSDDDGIEIFGGTVNVTNLVIYANTDDAVDLDEGYAGTITNVVVQTKAATDNIFEIDGTEDSTDANDGQFTIKDVTYIGVAGNTTKTDQLGHWKSDATGTTENVLYTVMDGQVIEGIDADTYSATATTNAVNTLIFKNFQFQTTTTLAAILANTADTTTATPAWASVVSSGSVGADTSVFGWTMWYQTTQQ
jgi:hypothetical protein